MGTKMAPLYANLFMGRLETHLLEVAAKKPTIWWRHIDDVFTIWRHGEGCLNQFFEQLNNMHSTIKFTVKMLRVDLQRTCTQNPQMQSIPPLG